MLLFSAGVSFLCFRVFTSLSGFQFAFGVVKTSTTASAYSLFGVSTCFLRKICCIWELEEEEEEDGACVVNFVKREGKGRAVRLEWLLLEDRGIGIGGGEGDWH